MPDQLSIHIEDELKNSSCGSRRKFIEILNKEYERVKEGVYGNSTANPKPSYADEHLGSPLKRVVFEIEHLLHQTLSAQSHNSRELCVWMLYVSRHGIKSISKDQSLLTPDDYRPWDGFDELVRPQDTNPNLSYLIEHSEQPKKNQLRSWRCFSKFFMEEAGSFVMSLSGIDENPWKILRMGKEESEDFTSQKWGCSKSNEQKELDEAIGAFAALAANNFYEVKKQSGQLYIVGVGSHDKKWPFKDVPLVPKSDEADGDNLNSVFLVFSLSKQDEVEEREQILIKIGSILGVINACLRRALSVELHDIVKRDAERLDELAKVLAGAPQGQESGRITLESLLIQALPEIGCVKLCAGCDVSDCEACDNNKVLWADENAPTTTQQKIELSLDDIKDKYGSLTDEDRRVWGDKRYRLFFAEHLSATVLPDTVINHGHREQALRIAYVLLLRMRSYHASLSNAGAAIMGRNMSHNIGSHVLSEINDEAMKDSNGLKSLHAYLQRRMDLVARITSRSPDWGEPLWFLGDLMQGFFSQTILLDTLVRDQGGWGKGANGGKKIIFVLHHEEDKEINIEPIVYETNQETNQISWRINSGPQFNDFLVSIPDGAIGAQAFYVFLESLMRNSAKYGRAKEAAEFKIHLDIREEDGYYEIGIWDTLSTCSNIEQEALCAQLQGKIMENLINEKGELTATSLGIAEMKAACDFLIHPFGMKYPVKPLEAAGGQEGCDKCTGKSSVASNRAVDARVRGSWPLWVECYLPPAHDNLRYLRYRLHLAKPKMVGVVGYNKDLPVDADKMGVVKLSDKAEFTGADGAFQFAILLVKDGQKQAICEWISLNHRYLPQRLLLVKDTGITECNVEPSGRAVWCTEGDIFGNDGEQINGERLILNVYEIWIKKKWLIENEPVILNISYERGKAPQQWKNINNIKGLEFAKVVVWKETENSGGWEISNSRGGNCHGGISLHYSNHGTAHTGVVNPKVVVQFKNGDLTTELLFAPPSSLFGLSYFLLGLIEAALMKVTIVDERVALWVVEPGPDIAEIRMENAEKQNVDIVFKYNDSKFLTKGLEDYSMKITKHMDPIKGNFVESKSYPEGIFKTLGNRTVDLVVLHLGVAETAAQVNLVTENTAEEASKYTPVVVMMSGRGGLKERTAGDMPFIEYSTVRQCFSQTGNISKYHLAKSLMSAKANCQ